MDIPGSWRGGEVAHPEMSEGVWDGLCVYFAIYLLWTVAPNTCIITALSILECKIWQNPIQLVKTGTAATILKQLSIVIDFDGRFICVFHVGNIKESSDLDLSPEHSGQIDTEFYLASCILEYPKCSPHCLHIVQSTPMPIVSHQVSILIMQMNNVFLIHFCKFK